MEKRRRQIILSVLWIVLVVNHTAYILQYLIKPESMNSLKSAPSEMALYSLTLFFFAACFMALLSLTVKDSINRWTNIILGTIFTIIKVLVLYSHLANEGMSGFAVNELWGALAGALVVWYAWKWPKQES